MSSAPTQSSSGGTSADKPKTLQGRVKELLALIEGGNLEEPFPDHMRTMIKMVCFIHQELRKKTGLATSDYKHIDGISGDIWTSLNELKTQILQRIRLLTDIEKSLPNKKNKDDKTPTAASYSGSDDTQQWTEALDSLPKRSEIEAQIIDKFQDTWHKEIFIHYLRLKEHSFDPSGFLDQTFGAVLAVLHELNALMSKLNLYRTAWLSHIKVSSDYITEADLPTTPSSSQRARRTQEWTAETAGHHQAQSSWAGSSTRSRSDSQPSHSSPPGPSTSSPRLSTERPSEALIEDDSVSTLPYIYPQHRSRPAEPRRPSYEAQLSGIPEEQPYGTHRRGSTGVLSPIAVHLRSRAALRKGTR